ncbi:MAG TPA: DUF63 family protein [archaeon]|nr:DUF63 family protein [archaeon]
MFEFVYENFCRPAIDTTVQGYNIYNTALYALILFLLTVYFVYPLLKKNKIAVDFKFILALIPFVVFGSAFRVLNDIGIFSKTCSPLEFGFYTFTPGIWLLTAAITIISLLIAKKLAKNEEQFPLYFGGLGLLFALPVVIFELSIFEEWQGAAIVVALSTAITFATKFAVELKYKNFFSNKANILVVAGQVLDGSATFVATHIFNCGEQHPLSATILGVNPALFIVVKIIIALLIIHAADSDIKDENFRNFVKLAVIILGFATGTRDLLTLGVGTCS